MASLSLEMAGFVSGLEQMTRPLFPNAWRQQRAVILEATCREWA